MLFMGISRNFLFRIERETISRTVQYCTEFLLQGGIPFVRNRDENRSQLVLEKMNMDALELLKTDHAKVRELLKKAQNTKDETQRKRLFEQIRTELETHTHIEETIFYP